MPLWKDLIMWLALASPAFAQTQAEQNHTNTIIAAHGFIMAVAFVILYPTGALIIRLLPGCLTIWIHATWQAFAYLCVLAGLGMGAWIATTGDEWLGPLPSGTNNGHPIIGVIVTALLLLMPVTGLIHHSVFKKQGSRGSWTFIHVWLGRLLMLLGIINGGLGIQLSGGPTWAIIAYSALAAVFSAIWLGTALHYELKSASL